MTDKLEQNKLIDAAESHAESYDDDDRQDIKTDVMNAFFAGAKWQAQNTPIAKDFAALERVIRVAALMEAVELIKGHAEAHSSKVGWHLVSRLNGDIRGLAYVDAIQFLITKEDE